MNENELVFRIEKSTRSAGMWRIHGLDLLAWNDVPEIDHLLPFKVWLECLLANDAFPAVLIGGRTFEDACWQSCVGDDYTEVDTTVYCGDLFSSRQAGGVKPGIFVPEIARATLLSTLMDECYPADNALMIMSGAADPAALADVLQRFTTEDEVLANLRKLARWVVVPGHDGDYLEIWSEQTDGEGRMLECSVAADLAVKKLLWFRTSHGRLRWDEDTLCYRLALASE